MRARQGFSLLAVVFGVAFAVTPATALAQVVKCTSPDGSVTYSDSECPAGSRTHAPNLVDSTTSSEALKEATDAYPSQRRVVGAGTGERRAGSGGASFTRADCDDAMRSYEIAAAAIHKDPYAIAAKRDRAQYVCKRAR